MKPLGRALRLIAVNGAILIALLAVLEVLLWVGYERTERPPSGLRALFRQYRAEYEGQAIQAIPECARYDSVVAYTLRPGECRFTSPEFSTTVRANSAGFRDDERSLAAPGVVLAGDSFTMGWGVEQEESFAQQLEAELGVPVLNTGISSFGTARELRALTRLDLDSLRVLVIQYHPNDFKENRAYAESGDSLPVMPAPDYDALSDRPPPKESGYRFGRFVYEAQKLVTNGLIGLIKNKLRSDGHQADAFLHVLATAPIDLDGVRILVFEVNDHAQNDAGFIAALRARLDAPGLPDAVRGMTIIDISGALNETHYYPWDGHLTPEGHAVIAAALADALRGQRSQATSVPE